jgi:hypothetical protein
MSEQDRTGQQPAGGQGEAGPQGESRAGNEGPLSYRKNEEDATMLNEEERTGEGTGAKAGEYS